MSAGKELHEGQTVWVRPLQEILGTLDADGTLDGLPFMPEMARYCEQSFQVSCLPIRTCVEGYGFRGLNDTVFLEGLRCDGGFHDACQRECLLFWRKAWLSDVAPGPTDGDAERTAVLAIAALPVRRGDRFFCQSTQLAAATCELPPATRPSLMQRLHQHGARLWRGEIGVGEFVARAIRAVLKRAGRLIGIDTSERVRGALIRTEAVSLNLKQGDWVEVKARREIEAALDTEGKNRGLLFDPPMLAHCGRRYRVAGRLERMIHEETGRMVTLQNTVVLDGVTCPASRCPRANPHFWREMWLKRVADGSGAQAAETQRCE
jgi:hypothetical protein